jgi:rare lipoprotein A
MSRLLPSLGLLGILTLAACSSAPKKPPTPPPAASAPPPAQPAGARKVSPYAPAQEDPSKRGDYVAGGLYAPGVKDSAPAYIPDVDAIPEPEVVDEPRSRYGNRSPYHVLGRAYHVLERADGHVEEGLASYYGNKFHGRRTSSQEVYDMYAFTAAHRSLPLPSFARVTNLENGRSVVVRVNDRGPFHDGRVIDLSYAAAVKLGIHPRGTGRVEVRGLTPGNDTRPAYAAASAGSVTRPAGPGLQASAIDSLVETLPAVRMPAGVPGVAAAPVAGQAAPVAGSNDWRFDMHQDGRIMTADDFDAWMQARGVRIVSDPPGQGGGDAAPPRARAYAMTPAPAPTAPVPARDAAVARASTVQASAAAPAPVAPGVTLQLAAFGALANAERALALLRQAGIPDARLLAGSGSGAPLWRLRVGPVDPGQVAELSARVAGLGFGMPQVVRD